ncbi:MAG: class I SAM-dependent methyltransferase, partial [Polymorphobacter sp.]
MTDRNADTNQAAWTGYWLGAGRDSGCLPGAPKPLNDALLAAWAAFAGELPQGAQLLDIATGSGSVVRALMALRPDIVSIGIDSAALPDLGPASVLDLRGDIDAAALPFADASFDAVSSQFGIEYCPPAALAEAGRSLRPGGALGFVVHCRASQAVAHNRGRRAALVGLRDAGIFAMARRAMTTDTIDDKVRTAVDAARRAHAAQRIVDELPVAIEA